jgi:hypothetical protein
MFSAREHLLSCCHINSVRGKRVPENIVRVIAKNLVGGTVTVRAQSKARALVEVAQRINPLLKQDRYEFQLVEFLEIAQRTQCVDPDLKADSSQTMEAALKR